MSSVHQLQRIRDHYEDPFHRGRCDRLTHYGEAVGTCSAAGQDAVVVELRIVDDQLVEIWFDGDGCELSQAFASMTAETLEGKSIDEVKRLTTDLLLSQLELTVEPARQPCCQVGITALHEAINSQQLDESEGLRFLGPDLGDEC